MSSSAKPTVYFKSLEGWRGIASMLVLTFHVYSLFSTERIVAYGYLWVDFFFILSGFIMALQYEQAIVTRTITFGQFCVRRLARLYPLYILSIIIFMLINEFLIEPDRIARGLDKAIEYGRGPETGWMVLVQLLMLSNISDMPAPWNSAAWSISVEWVVNLLFFAILYIFKKIPSLLLALGTTYCTIYLMVISPHTLELFIATKPFFNPTIARGIVGFCIGVLLYRYHHTFPKFATFKLNMLEIMFIFSCYLMLQLHGTDLPIGVDYAFTLFLFPSLIIISIQPKSLISKITSTEVFRFFGRISYSVYLLHIPAVYAYEYSPYYEIFSTPWRGIVFYIIFIPFCWMIYHGFEKPMRNLIRNTFDPPSGKK